MVAHTNYQQIITTNCCVPNIKDDGLLVVEYVHTSYIKINGIILVDFHI